MYYSEEFNWKIRQYYKERTKDDDFPDGKIYLQLDLLDMQNGIYGVTGVSKFTWTLIEITRRLKELSRKMSTKIADKLMKNILKHKWSYTVIFRNSKSQTGISNNTV